MRNQKIGQVFLMVITVIFAISKTFVRMVYACNILYTTSLVRYSKETKHYYQSINNPVELSGNQGETISFQIVFLGKSCSNTKIVVTHLRSQHATIPKKAIRLFSLEACIPDYPPDCLVPIKPGTMIGSDLNLDTTFRTIWIDIQIADEQQEGLYKGKFIIIIGERDIPFNVRLRVSKSNIYKKSGLKIDLNNYGLTFISAWGLKSGTPQARKAAWAVYKLARAHGATFNPLPYKSQRGNPRPDMAPLLEGKGAKMHVADWSAYDQFYGPLFDGSLFEDGRPIDHQYLPFNPEWPSDFNNFFSNRQEYEIEWRRIAQEFIQHFRQKGWVHTTLYVYMNQKPRPNNRIPWNLDEPKGDRDYNALKYFANLTHNAFINANPLDVLFRIDISHFYCDQHMNDPLKDFRKNNGWQILSPVVDVWAISRHSMSSKKAQLMAARLQEMGRTIFVYISAPALDESLSAAQKTVKQLAALGINGIIYWNTVHKVNAPVRNKGTDFLIYADPRFPGIPLASLRLKAIRAAVAQWNRGAH